MELMPRLVGFAILLSSCVLAQGPATALWQRHTITFEGPATSEDTTPNPFRDYRLTVTFRHPTSGKSYVVPGFFAADGNAAETSAKVGNRWRVHFTPDETGAWNYEAFLRQGAGLAGSTSPARVQTGSAPAASRLSMK